MDGAMALTDHLRACWRRLRRETTIARLTAERINLERENQVLSEHYRKCDAVDQAAWRWLQARIALQGESSGFAEAGEMAIAEETLDRTVRAAHMHPGLRGSWGRGVPRDWDCWVDPKHGGPREGGCECAGGGRDAVSSSECPYRYNPPGERPPTFRMGDRVYRAGGPRQQIGTVLAVKMHTGYQPYTVRWDGTTEDCLYYAPELERVEREGSDERQKFTRLYT